MDSPLEVIRALGRTAQLTLALLGTRNARVRLKHSPPLGKRRPRRDRCIEANEGPSRRPLFHHHFPEEIIIQILEELCVSDIQSVGMTCKRLHSISSSLLSQYLSDLSQLGLGLNRDCALPFRLVRSSTTSRSKPWATLKPRASASTRVLPFDAANHSLFYITDRGYLCVKERARDRLRLAWKRYKRMPVPVTHDEPEAEENNNDANEDGTGVAETLVMDGAGSKELRGQIFLDCVDLYEDLLVVLQRRPVADALQEFDDPDDNEFPPSISPGSPFLRFLRMSGGDPHPDAAFPVFPLTSLSSSILRNIGAFDSSLHGLKTCGSTCGFLQFAHRVDFIYVDWRKGIGPMRMSNIGGSKRRPLDFFFLDPSTVCFILGRREPALYDNLELQVFRLSFRTSRSVSSRATRRSISGDTVDVSSTESVSSDDNHKDPEEASLRSKTRRAILLRVARLSLPRQSRAVACNITTDAEPSPHAFTRKSARAPPLTSKTASRFSFDGHDSIPLNEGDSDMSEDSRSSSYASHEYPDPDGGVAFAVFDHPTSAEMAPFELGVIFSLAGVRKIVQRVETGHFGPECKHRVAAVPWEDWGPPVSRAVPIPISRCFYAPPICGRLALAPILPALNPPGAVPGTPPVPARASIRIRDFNPGRVKWAREVLASGGQLPTGARLVEGESEVRSVIFPWGFKTALPFYEVKIDRDLNGEEGVDVKFMELARGWLLIANSSFPELDVDDVFTIHNFL